MRVIEIEGSFGLDNLRLAERPEPEPGPGQVLVAMRAASLNYRDLMMVRGLYNPRQPLPLVPCSDGAGVVEAVGDGVTRVAPGDRVATLFSQSWMGGEPPPDGTRSTLGGPLDGALQEKMVLPERGVIRFPEHLSDVEAACLPCAGLTAWSAVVTHGRITAGNTVLVLGTGGVSLFALQFASALGARVIVTSSRDEKLERARELGAAHGVNYRETPKWGRTVRELTGGRGVDLVVEVGGAGTLAQSLEAVRVGGTVAMIGVLSGPVSDLSVVPILMKSVRVQGILVGSREGFEGMSRAIEVNRIAPVVDSVRPFTEAKTAFERMAAGEHFGKICLEIEEGR
ncbi:MAG: NAD(P)-dependent alcohol dehydrogenase [Thermoanaerobaculia bacterium]|nr:NAD(P)-dependent alcohol dehydrogenase [Thermoanaerobaculia bacterium]